ncbi:hypothetical protein GCM10023192_63840 [Amycolatopsis samaneae]
MLRPTPVISTWSSSRSGDASAGNRAGTGCAKAPVTPGTGTFSVVLIEAPSQTRFGARPAEPRTATANTRHSGTLPSFHEPVRPFSHTVPNREVTEKPPNG